MSRRSNKQSKVVPISLADELDELMSSESIKPNIAFLGLAPEPSSEAPPTPEIPASVPIPEANAQPRLVLRSGSYALPEIRERSSAPDADVNPAKSPFISASGVDRSSTAITTPVAETFIAMNGAGLGQSSPDADIAPASQGSWQGLADNPGRQPGTAPSADRGAGMAIEHAAHGFPQTSPSTAKEGKQLAVGRPAKIHKCSKAQDGHSHIEEVLYGVLRRAGRPEEAPSQNVITQAGSSFLCKETRIHKRNLGSILRRLVFKQTIEILDYERSTTRTARRYRVFSYGEILKKRREAGLEWVVRRRGVEFVNPATGEPLFDDPGAVDAPDASPDAVTALSTAITSGDPDAFTTGDSDADTPSASAAVTASPLGKEAREALKGSDQEKKKTTSSVDLSLVSNALQRYWQTDEDAVRQLVRSCSAVRPDCTTDEILNFIEEKGYLLSKNPRTFTNPVGFLLHSIPKCFEGPTFDRWRERQKLAQQHKLEEEKRQQEEHQASLKWMEDYCNKTLANPNASQVERQRAQLYLEELKQTQTS